MLDITFRQAGGSPRNANVTINGHRILVTSFQLKASVDKPLTEVTITGITKSVDLKLQNLRPENLVINGTTYVKKEPDDIINDIEIDEHMGGEYTCADNCKPE